MKKIESGDYILESIFMKQRME